MATTPIELSSHVTIDLHAVLATFRNVLEGLEAGRTGVELKLPNKHPIPSGYTHAVHACMERVRALCHTMHVIELGAAAPTIRFNGRTHAIVEANGSYRNADNDGKATDSFLRMHVRLSSSFVDAYEDNVPCDTKAVEHDVEKLRVIAQRSIVAMLALHPHDALAQEQWHTLAVIPILASTVVTNYAMSASDMVVGFVHVTPWRHMRLLSDFMRPYRALPNAADDDNVEEESKDNIVSIAHVPRQCLSAVGVAVLNMIARLHRRGFVVGSVGEHMIAYAPTDKGRNAPHVFDNNRVVYDRCDAFTPHSLYIDSGLDFCMVRTAWTLVNLETCNHTHASPSHYTSTTVSPFGHLKPADFAQIPHGASYFRAFNMLNDYEALVHLLANMHCSHHDRNRLAGLEDALDCTPSEATTRFHWFAKMSMAYYPPWARTMMYVIDHEREVLLREAPHNVISWEPSEVQNQLQTLLATLAHLTQRFDDVCYTERYCVTPSCIPDQISRLPRMQRMFDADADNAAWAITHGKRRTPTGERVAAALQRSAEAFVPGWMELRRAVRQLNRDFVFLDGIATSTIVPQQLLPASIGGDTNINGRFGVRGAELERRRQAETKTNSDTTNDPDNDEPNSSTASATDTRQRKTSQRHEVGMQAIAYARVLCDVYSDVVSSTDKLESLTAADLAVIIAYTEETMQVLVDNIDCGTMHACYHPDTHQCVLDCDEVLHKLVVAILEHRGEQTLQEARHILAQSCHRAHSSRTLQFTSEQFARLFVLSMHKYAEHKHTSKFYPHPDTEATLHVIQYLRGILEARLEQPYPRHATDREKSSLEHETAGRAACAAFVDKAETIRRRAAREPSNTTQQRTTLP